MIEVNKEIDLLYHSSVWDRDGEMDRAEAEKWILGLIARVRADTLESIPKRVAYYSCEGCSTRIRVKDGEFPEGWVQFGQSRFRRTGIGNWCPDCAAKERSRK